MAGALAPTSATLSLLLVVLQLSVTIRWDFKNMLVLLDLARKAKVIFSQWKEGATPSTRVPIQRGDAILAPMTLLVSWATHFL